MDAKTTDLLMKYRKGATASFNVAKVVQLCAAVGWHTKVSKEGNRVVALTVKVTPEGPSITSVKEDRYRYVLVYDILNFMKLNGMVETVSAILGLPTYEEEQAEKKRYGARVDIENTGICPCCFGHFKMAGGRMVHHGYQRPGDGSIYGDCLGVGEPSIEQAPDGVQKLIAAIESELQTSKAALEWLESDACVSIGPRFPGGPVHKKGEPSFEQERHYEVRRYQLHIERKTKALACAKDLRVAWKLDELPEVRFPKHQPLIVRPEIDAYLMAG